MFTRGHIDEMYSQDDVLHVNGWMFNPDLEFSSVDAVVNGDVVATEAPGIRTDVAKAFPWIRQAAQSGFRVAISNARSGDRLEVLGRRDRQVVTRLRSILRLDLDGVAPTPPPTLLRRAAGADVRGFKADGLRHFTAFADAVNRHRPLPSVRRMLDWGCGCGRLSVHFLLDGNVPALFGCDIDQEAIGWCQDNLPDGEFRSIGPFPPTSYADEFFDLVIACSVFTHLNRETQKAWLVEMRRIIAPGGLLIASIHGRFAASFAFPPSTGSLIERLRHRIGVPIILASGFSDWPDHALDGVAPDGYYRAAFQTRPYTLREWSKDFEILELVEAGMAYQDLIVMRRPGM